MIDELDRCKPPFSLSILERVKHLFSVQGVHFILSCHLPQLEGSLRHTYGSELNANIYLQKFYTLLAHFPQNSGQHRSERDISKFVEHAKRALLSDKPPSDAEEMFGIVADLAEVIGMSFRSIEKTLVQLVLGLTLTPHNYLKVTPIVPLLCVLKINRPDLFLKAKAGNLTFSDITSLIRFDEWPQRASTRKEFIINWLLFCLAPDLSAHPYIVPQDYLAFLMKYSLYDLEDRHKVIPFMANGVVDRFAIPS